MNFPEDDVDKTSENSDTSCLNTQSSQVHEENDATPSLNNNTLTPNPQTVFPSDFEILFWGHSIITFALRGEGGFLKMRTKANGGEGGFLPSRTFAKKNFFY